MPSGYTDTIYREEPQTFEQFVLSCSRAFGALIMMRDDSRDTPIPATVQPSTFYTDWAKAARRKRGQIARLTDEQATARALREWRRSKKQRVERIIDMNDLKWRYEQMLRQVQQWEPPTDEHVGLKDFMVQQLSSSIDFDIYTVEPAKEPLSGTEWREQQLERLDQEIARYERDQAEENERAMDRTLWIQHLLKSLGIEFSDSDTIPVT